MTAFWIICIGLILFILFATWLMQQSIPDIETGRPLVPEDPKRWSPNVQVHEWGEIGEAPIPAALPPEKPEPKPQRDITLTPDQVLIVTAPHVRQTLNEVLNERVWMDNIADRCWGIGRSSSSPWGQLAEKEFAEWMETPEGKFAEYLARKEGV